MKTRESRTLAELTPGLLVAAAVTDTAGRVLLPAGVELTESSIAALARRGIAQVQIEVDAPDDPAAVAAHSAHVAAQLERLFRRAGAGAETLILRQAILDYRLRRDQ